MSAKVTAVVDPGMPGVVAESREYWPQEERGSSWWSSTNWFRVPDSNASVTMHTASNNAFPSSSSAAGGNTTIINNNNNAAVTTTHASSAVAITNDLQPQNTISIEVGGAVSFSRFSHATTVGKPAKVIKRKRLCLEAFRGHSPTVIKQLNELVAVPLLHPGLFRAVGIAPPHGLILSGSSGSGKSVLIRRIVEELRVHFTPVDCATLISDPSKVVDKEGTPISKLFANCVMHQPALLLLDDVENIARGRETGESEYLTKLRASLRTELDSLSAKGHTVLVIGATNNPEVLCPSLLRSGRFDQHIMLSKPDTERRLELLLDATKDMKLTPLAKTYLRSVAEKSAGYVACDISALCVEAGLQCVREELYRGMDSTMDFPQEFSKEELQALVVCRRHFKAALKAIRPSGMRSVEVEIPNVKWSDVGGQENVKEKLIESVEYPLKYATVVQYFGLSPSASLLLYGPPGCGKTLMAQAVATQCQASFISVKGPELLSSYLGESEKNLRALFLKARQNAPCVLFFDEIDSVGRARQGTGNDDRFVAQLLALMDEKPAPRKRELKKNNTSSSSSSSDISSPSTPVTSSATSLPSPVPPGPIARDKESVMSAEEEVNKDLVFVMAATNRPGLLDPALLRRFDQLLYVGLPKLRSRLAIFQAALKATPLDPAVDLEFLQSLAARTRGFSGSDLAQICNRARWLAIQSHISSVGGAGDEGQISLPFSSETKTEGSTPPPSVPWAPVTVAQFETALAATTPSVSDADLTHYKTFKAGDNPEVTPEKAKMQQRIIQSLFKEALSKQK